MGDKTGIEWTEATWNPLTGCTKVSPGCDNCYAESIAHRFDGTPSYPNGFAVTLRPERLDQPLRWRRPRRIFVNSMSDLFHDQVPDEYIARVWAMMALSPRHTYQLLTKRHGRMRSLIGSEKLAGLIYRAVNDILGQADPPRIADDTICAALDGFARSNFTVLPNVWGMVSAEDQRRAELRIPALLETPFAVRGVSAEPLLGPIDLIGQGGNMVGAGMYALPDPPEYDGGDPVCQDHGIERCSQGCTFLDWVITGGESGPGARPAHPDWFRSLRDQCQAAGVAYLHKQHGEWVEDATDNGDGTRTLNIPGDAKDYRRCALHLSGRTALTPDNPFHPFRAGHGGWTSMRRVGKKAAGRELDGRTWDEYPEAVQA